jgi:hypothetical protein
MRIKEVVMSYSSHVGSSGLGLADGVPPVAEGKGATRLGWVSLAVVVLTWVGFGLAMWVAPGALVDIWEWVGGLSIAFKLVFWVLGLPWMLGLAIWQTGWPEAVQLALITGTALASIWTFYPKRTV